MAVLRENRYGKTGVRLMKVTRDGATHSIAEWTVRVLLEGEYVDVFLHGDNTDVLATDTMKNTVYARAHGSTARSMEAFAAELSSFLLGRNERVTAVEVHIESAMWKRLMVDGKAHSHAFMKGSGELATATLKRRRDGGVELRSGLEDMVVLKTAQSGFVGFKRDELTTLPETEDRLLGTAVAASWMYAAELDDRGDAACAGECARNSSANVCAAPVEECAADAVCDGRGCVGGGACFDGDHANDAEPAQPPDRSATVWARKHE